MNSLLFIQRVQALAQAGLAFSKDPYDQERYTELLTLAEEQLVTKESQTGNFIDYATYQREAGYPTPKIDVRGVIIADDRILLVQDSNSQEWSLPGGFAEIGYSPKENIIKEVFEETGLVVDVERLIAIHDTNQRNPENQPIQYYKFFFACNVLSGELSTSLETADVAFFDLAKLPVLSTKRTTQEQLAYCFSHFPEETVCD